MSIYITAFCLNDRDPHRPSVAGIIQSARHLQAARSWHLPLHYVDWRPTSTRLRCIAAIAHQTDV